MRVSLINTTIKDQCWVPWPPLGLGYIAAVLEREGHKVQLIDKEVMLRRNEGNFNEVNRLTASMLKKHKPDFVGISSMTPTIPGAFFDASLAKKLFPEVPVVLGGIHASALPEKTLAACKDMDMIVRGEGEYTFRDLADSKDPKKLKGVVYRAGGRIIANEQKEPVPNLDELPFPARHLMDMEWYTKPRVTTIRGVYLRATSIITSRGCPNRCVFCAGPFVSQNRIRFNSAGYIIREIEELVDKYHVEGLYFADDMFTTHRKRVLEFCSLMEEKGLHERLKWCVQARVNAVDSALLQAMKKAGCIQVEYGFESASQRILDQMKKHTTVEQNYHAAKLTKEAGLKMLANIIVGMPGEKREDIEKSYEFLKKIDADFIGFNKLTPVPGTELWDTLSKEGRLKGDWVSYNFNDLEQNLTAMPKEELNELFLKIQREFVIPRNLASELRSSWMRPGYTFDYFPKLVLRFLIRKLFKSNQ